MSKNLGKDLDKDDLAKCTSLGDLFASGEADSEKVERALFGRLAVRKLKAGSTMFPGPLATDPTEVLPFLYFDKTLVFELCPGCPQTRDFSLISPLLENGALLVFMTGPFERAPPDFQKLVAEYPECVVGRRSYDTYRRLISNPIDPQHPSHEFHYDPGQVIDMLEPHTQDLENLPTDLRSVMERDLAGIVGIPSGAAIDFANEYLEILRNPTLEKASQLASAVALTYYAASADALGTTVQVNQDFIGRLGLLTGGLRIRSPIGLSPKDYLEFVLGFAGRLGKSIVPYERSEVLERAREINAEVDKIQHSKRRGVADILTKSYRWLPALTAWIVTKGSIGIEGVPSPPIRKRTTSHLSKAAVAIMARYYQVSANSVRVWQIRRALRGSS